MNATQPTSSRNRLAVTYTLAHLLEQLERSTQPVSAEQYRSVVSHLVNEFSDVASDTALSALLDAHPAAAELYENVHYEHAGLCRSSLEFSLAAEQQAKEVITRAMRAPLKDDANGKE
jgi:hypothetical protein